ncbi:MAG: amidohydrolase family protein [Terriglobia bacterium]|jgi:predicted TIM-barrel fold metal-dependent hydrolase|nr:amidohydrolase family protein [Terriglobia bacterium]
MTVSAQQIDPQLMSYIDSIQAIDNHAHVVAPDLAHDVNYDALRCEILPAATGLAPANTRFGPDVMAAWKALYDVVADSDSPANVKKVDAAQQAVRQREGANYFDWVLKQAGFDVVLANRVAMAPQLDARHFKWVPYDDALLFPLNNEAEKAVSPDRKVLYGAEEDHLKAYLQTAGMQSIPTTLDAYLDKVVLPILQSQKKAGAVAIKFEVAYLRPLDFAPATQADAARIYAQHLNSGVPSNTDYKVLQDYLFHYIAEHAGELGLAVHIHTGVGCGEYFETRGSDPMLLEGVLNDPSLRKTNFVLLHGGSPFERHNAALIMKPNVYVDTSVLELFYSPAELAHILRPWLEVMPEHVIFGTDSGPFGPGFNWEETAWVGSRNARRALGIVLTQMMNDGAITRTRAKEIAEDVLRKNAAELYKIQ